MMGTLQMMNFTHWSQDKFLIIQRPNFQYYMIQTPHKYIVSDVFPKVCKSALFQTKLSGNKLLPVIMMIFWDFVFNWKLGHH